MLSFPVILFFYLGNIPAQFLKAQICDPLPPVHIDSVSVDPVTGIANIGWTQNPSPDVNFYVIYIYNPSSDPPWDAIDTIYGAGNTWADIPGSDPSSGSETYAMAAYDFCGNSSFFSLTSAHSTIFLNSEYDECNRNVSLTWNNYQNWTQGVSRYKIWLSINNEPYTLIGTTTHNETAFNHMGVPPEVSLCYLVQAEENLTLHTTTSNHHCLVSSFPKSPDIHYLKYVTVTPDNNVKVVCEVDITADVKEYIIHRRTGGAYDKIEELPPGEIIGNELIYIDSDVDTDNESYTYKIDVVNTCGQTSASSNTGKTILLTLSNERTEMKNTLSWSAYENWEGDIASYNIYRIIDGNEQLIANVMTDVQSFEDNVFDFFDSSGDFCYVIEAQEGSGSTYNFQSQSQSNPKCVTQPPFVYIPNAFNPSGGITFEFKPVFSFVDPNSYYFSIYNRWGQKFFETTNPQQGWNGDAPSGVYIYRLEYQSASGQSFTTSGTVTLIK